MSKSNGFYRTMYAIFAGAVRFFYNIQVEGSENEPAEGGFLICSNHISNADVVIVAASFRRQVRFLAKAELFKIPLLKQLITALGAFPVDRGRADVGAVKKTIELLSEGECVGMYPQGHRQPGIDPRETRIKNGAAMMIYRASVPALPVLIQTKGMRIKPFRRTIVRIGKPVTPEELGMNEGTSAEYARASARLFDMVCDMYDPAAAALPAAAGVVSVTVQDAIPVNSDEGDANE